jgi:hypothetical protein
MPDDPYEQLVEFTEELPRNLRGEIRAKNHDPRKIEHSICDIIDNSIDAGASKIEITISYQDTFLPERGGVFRNDFMYLKDDGKGIRSEKLRQIISFYAERDYNPWELGSFGIGLKDSLLAHGNEITVFSKKVDEDPAWVRLSTTLAKKNGKDWVIVHSDRIGDNIPEELLTDAFVQAQQEISEMRRGTIIILEHTHSNLLDPRTEDEEGDEDVSGITMEDTLSEWIAMTFSDYLAGIDIGERKKESPLKISLNGNEIKPLDPFMVAEIGKGDFDGQQGTLLAEYEFNHDGMDIKLNRYILPNEVERERRNPGFDTRMITATRRGNPKLQGIYIKRNGRILDGPWKDMWRFQNHGMGYSHNTNCRWELILPPDAIERFELVTPDKREVDLSEMAATLRTANREKITWHPQDLYAYGQTRGGEATTPTAQYNHRGRARNNSNDLIKICAAANCGKRCIPYTNDYCEEHTRPKCQICNQPKPINSDGWCQDCVNSVCSTEGCDNLKIQSTDLCRSCSQPECVVVGCENLQLVHLTVCQSHSQTVCAWPDCNNQFANGLKVCEEHNSQLIEGVNYTIISEDSNQPLIQKNDDGFVINLGNPQIENLLKLLNSG